MRITFQKEHSLQYYKKEILNFFKDKTNYNKCFNLIEKSYIYLLLLVLICFFLMFNQMISKFHETPFDGVFQTLFALRKLDNGWLPGIDFFYFHGNGIPYLLYPIYFVLHSITGQELSSSLWSTYIINLAFLYGPIYLFFWKKYGINYAAASILVISVINEVFFFLGFYNSPLFIGAPMAVRFSPHTFMLIIFAFYSTDYDEKSLRKLILILAVFLGVSPLLAAEQGVFAIIGSAAAVLFLKGSWRERIFYSGSILIISVLVFIAIQVLFFHNLETIHAMKTISDNQVWVYGVFPNNFFASLDEIFSFSKILALPSQVTTLLASSVLIVVLIAIKESKRTFFVSILAMYFGGILSWASNIGYVGQHQSAIFLKLILIVMVVLILEKAHNKKVQ